ncbi:type IV pilin N-terminal domain-containing protein [Methanosarcina sp. MTP4]|uniref:type IV pilin N-terminal domain-containing protein n=1 Tax=Methanosarcina sp. MTP4 TaxID=1434100 RepID=UPI000A86A523|nr:type IV pilin N-terminal domain-containing protein [Methanosarcina sp. MTP4]
MFDVKKLLKNRCAVSEVMGEVLLTSIAVLLVSFIAIFISTYDGATDIPHTQVKEWMDTDSNMIYLKHSGGEFLETEAIEIVANINGERYVYPSSEIYTNLGNSSSWQLGDTIAIDTYNEWGVNITNDNEIRVFLIDTSTRQTIQYLTVSLEETGSSDWVPPQGEVEDTSTGGIATPYHVYEESDNLYTTYYPPQNLNNYRHEEFNFTAPSTIWGIDRGGNVTDVDLKIVYRTKDNSFKNIKLRIWDAYPLSGTWHEETLEEQTSFAPKTIDLSTYINNTYDLENLTVQLVAESTPESAGKTLNVDYIALKVS